jgi:hypothetical protein
LDILELCFLGVLYNKRLIAGNNIFLRTPVLPTTLLKKTNQIRFLVIFYNNAKHPANKTITATAN